MAKFKMPTGKDSKTPQVWLNSILDKTVTIDGKEQKLQHVLNDKTLFEIHRDDLLGEEIKDLYPVSISATDEHGKNIRMLALKTDKSEILVGFSRNFDEKQLATNLGDYRIYVRNKPLPGQTNPSEYSGPLVSSFGNPGGATIIDREDSLIPADVASNS